MLAMLAMLWAPGGCGGSSAKHDGAIGSDSGSGTDGGPNGDAAQTVQYFNASWALDDALTGAPLTCAQAAAATVAVHVDAMTFTFACTAGQGMTGIVAPGSHSVSASLLDAAQASLSEAQAMTFTLVANVPSALPAITFDVY